MYRMSPCKAVCKKVLHAYLQHKRKAFGYNKQAMIAITAKEGDGIAVSLFIILPITFCVSINNKGKWTVLIYKVCHHGSCCSHRTSPHVGTSLFTHSI